MPQTALRLRPAAFALFAVFASLLSCGREVTGPDGAGRSGVVALDPQFPSIRLAGSGEVLGIGAIVPFERVRIVLRRASGEIVIDRVVDFPLGQETISLSFNVPLAAGAPSTGEPISATMRFINAAGDTVFAAGPVTVLARAATAGNPPPPVPIVPEYVGVGAGAASVVIAPDSFIGTISQTSSFTASARDAAQLPLPGTPIAFTSTDSARVRVGLGTGLVTLIGARGTALIIAQTLTGQSDTALVRITPTASALALVSGGGQQTLQGTPFPTPVRVRVNAADGLGVQGVTVNFAVTGGAGSVSAPSVVTDAGGEAQVTWTAGNVAGSGAVTASVPATAISLVVNGQQLSSAPTSLAFSASPANFTAGAIIPPFTVNVLNAGGSPVAGFSGQVSLSLSGGTAGASIIGTSAVSAVNGVASFSGLTVNRGGSAYRLVAGVTGVPSALSNTFDVAAAPPTTVAILSGAGQTAPPSTPLPDSIRVRVTDQFGFPQPGLSAQFAVVAGGGTVSPGTVTTDSGGRAATRWTLGAAGAQQITVTVGAIQPVPVSATVFTGGGTPTLFIGTQQISATIGSARTVPVFITPASGATIVAQLVMRDTLVAQWAADSVIFTPGAGLRTPSLTGRGVGSTFGIVTSSAGTDSVRVTVDSVGIVLPDYGTSTLVIGDTVPYLIRLSAPAGVGGVTVTVRSGDSLALRVAAGSGRTPPADPCDIYCYDLKLTPDEVSVLGTPAESALVTIPQGQLAGYVVLFPVGAAPNGVQLTASSPNVAQASKQIITQPGTLYLYPYWGFIGAPLPVGHREVLDVETYDQLAREVPVRFTSRNPAVVRVDSLVVIPPGREQYNSYTRIAFDGVAPGNTWIVTQAAGFATDSFAVNVVAPWLVMTETGAVTVVGGDYDLGVVSSADSTNSSGYVAPRGSDLSVSAVSRSPAIAQVIQAPTIRREEWVGYARVRGLSPGSAWIVTTAPGYAPDSVLITVAGATLQVQESYYRIGSGQVHESMRLQLLGGGNLAGTGQVATIVSSDTTVLTVATPVVPFDATGSTAFIRFLGRAIGSATVTITVPGIAPAVQPFTVTEPDLFLSTFGSGGNVNADSASYSVSTAMRDGVNVARPPADTVIAILRSTNPAALLVTDSIVRYLPGSFSSSTARVRTIAPGTALLVLSAPNFRSDTSGLISVLPRRLEFSGTSFNHGRALDLSTTLSRRSPATSVLPLTVTAQGPAGVVPVAPSDSFPIGASTRSVVVRAGLGVGTDTVIVAAPGHASDTIFVVVGTSRAEISADTYGLVGQQDDFVTVYMRPSSIFSYRPAGMNLRFAVQSSDTTVVRVLADTIRVNAGSTSATTGGYGSVRFVRPGTAWLRLVDPTGTFVTDSQQVTVEYQQLYAGGGSPTIGVAQQSSEFEYYVYRDFSLPDSLWVRLTSSVPSLVSVPDSVLFPPFSSYTYFGITAGDTVGSARITGTAPGYTEFVQDVFVTRSRLEAYTRPDLGIGAQEEVDVYLTDVGTSYTRGARDPFSIRLRVDDPTLLAPGADSVATFSVGTEVLRLSTLRGLAEGRTGFVVEDQRSSTSILSALSSRQNVEVRRPRLRFTGDRLRAGLGSITSGFQHYFTASTSGPDAWVRFTSTSGRVLVPGDSLFFEPSTYSSFMYFDVQGLSLGTDTLVISAPGYDPDSLIVDVSRNLLLRQAALPSVIRMGDSVQVTLRLVGPDGFTQMQAAGVPLSLTFASTGGIQAVAIGGGNLTTTSIPIGDSTITFWMRATGPAGGSIDISGPSIMSLPLGIATRP